MIENPHITSPSSTYIYLGFWVVVEPLQILQTSKRPNTLIVLFYPKTNVPKIRHRVTKCCPREGRVVLWHLPTPLSFTGSFKRRKRKSIIVTVMLLIVSILILVFGLAATTRTQNITVGGYYPGVIVSMLLMFIVVRWTDCKPSFGL